MLAKPSEVTQVKTAESAETQNKQPLVSNEELEYIEACAALNEERSVYSHLGYSNY